MEAPDSGMQAAEQTSAEALLSAFKTIDPSERRKHASVLHYWLSIRGDKEFPPLHDLDPLEISDAGPNSVLLELISGGHDAEVRHIGEALRDEGRPERIIDAAAPSILASIAKKLPIVAISRDYLAFEDEFATLERATRCWVTLLPLSAGGAWVDYVYGLVSLEVVPAEGVGPDKASPPKKAKVAEAEAIEAEQPIDDAAQAEPVAAEQPAEAQDPVAEAEELADTEAELEESAAPMEETDDSGPMEEIAEVAEETDVSLDPLAEESDSFEDSDQRAKGRPGFSKLFDNLVGLTGFYGHGYKVDPAMSDTGPATAEPAAEQPLGEAAAGESQTDIPEPEATADETVVEPTPAEASVEEPAPIDEPVADAAAETAATEHSTELAAPVLEGPLQTKLTEVRAKADEARLAKLKANVALYEGLSAAYDFALDAEDAPEEYLRLVEAEGLKIQLRSPMRPVVKLAFNGMCDDSTIRQLEAVLAWALDNELPRGSLAEQIESAGGIGPILNGEAKAA